MTRSLVARARDDGRARGQGRRRPALGARRRRPRNLLRGLVALWLSCLACALTFLFIGQVWANHHVMLDHLRAADRIVLLLNTVLLMAVAFLPLATSVLADALRSGHGERTAVPSTASRSA